MENVEEYTMSTKEHFMFQEIATITDVKPYVLRFWETEFEEINPIIIDSGQKLYSKNDINIILMIKELLFDEKMSIPEAKVGLKQRLNKRKNSSMDLSVNNSSLAIQEDEEELLEASVKNFSEAQSQDIQSENLIEESSLKNLIEESQAEFFKIHNEAMKIEEDKILQAKDVLNNLLKKLDKIH